MNHVGRWWAPIVLSLLAAFTWWLREVATTPPPAPSNLRLHLPDYIMYDFTLTAMDNAGKPDYRLKAVSLRHYQDDGSTEVDQPQLTSFRGTGPSWGAVGERGWASANGTLLKLLGAVTMHRPPGPGSEEVTLITSDLTLHPKENYAETDREVTAMMGPNKMQGVGMRLFLAEGKVKLLSQVRSVYAPAHQ